MGLKARQGSACEPQTIPDVWISCVYVSVELRVRRRPNDRDGLRCGLRRSPCETPREGITRTVSQRADNTPTTFGMSHQGVTLDRTWEEPNKPSAEGYSFRNSASKPGTWGKKKPCSALSARQTPPGLSWEQVELSLLSSKFSVVSNLLSPPRN